MARRASTPGSDAKLVAELMRLTKEILTYSSNPTLRDPLIAEWNAKSGLTLAPWQFCHATGAFPVGLGHAKESTRFFVECVLAHVAEPPHLSLAGAETEVARLRGATPSWADAHATLRAMGHLVARPRDLARLVFFTDAPLAEMIAALASPDGEAVLLEGRAVAAVAAPLPGVDPEELRALVVIADRGIDASDHGDQVGLNEAAAELSRIVRAEIPPRDLARVPSAMNTEEWVEGLLRVRDLPSVSRPRFSELVANVAAVDSHANGTRRDAALERVESAIPYPHPTLDLDVEGPTAHAVALTITRHVDPWLDPPIATTEADVWAAARAWAAAREAKNFAGAVGWRDRLKVLLGEVDVPALRELLGVDDATRKTRLRELFPDVIIDATARAEATSAPTPVTPAPVASDEPQRVRHPKFGEGVVLSADGSGPDAKLEIRFADAVRKLQARFVQDV